MYGRASLYSGPKPWTHSGMRWPNARDKKTPPEKALARDSPSLFELIRSELRGTSQHTTFKVVSATWKMTFQTFRGRPNGIVPEDDIAAAAAPAASAAGWCR